MVLVAAVSDRRRHCPGAEDPPSAQHHSDAYHRICCWLLDIHIEIRGTMSTVAADAVRLQSHLLSRYQRARFASFTGSFIAKAEVADWPLFGYLAKLQRTVFIDRQRRTTTHHQRDQLAQRLDDGDNLILFPEGTSNDGNRTLPFRSALFGVAERTGENGATRTAAVDDSTGVAGLCAAERDADRPVAAALSGVVRRHGIARPSLACGRTRPHHRGRRIPSSGDACPIRFPQGPQRALPARGRRRRRGRHRRPARRLPRRRRRRPQAQRSTLRRQGMLDFRLHLDANPKRYERRRARRWGI